MDSGLNAEAGLSSVRVGCRVEFKVTFTVPVVFAVTFQKSKMPSFPDGVSVGGIVDGGFVSDFLSGATR